MRNGFVLILHIFMVTTILTEIVSDSKCEMKILKFDDLS